MSDIALLATAILLGGMTFFSFGFAPVLFKLMPMAQARPVLRGTFPYYYAVVIGLSALATALTLPLSPLASALLGAVTLSTLYARQILMAQINRATDDGRESAFKRLHGLSVVIQLMQLALCAWALLLI
ncbi:MAG: DUF4149 domain-containing protein [Pseudomonadota bacterium]